MKKIIKTFTMFAIAFTVLLCSNVKAADLRNVDEIRINGDGWVNTLVVGDWFNCPKTDSNIYLNYKGELAHVSFDTVKAELRLFNKVVATNSPKVRIEQPGEYVVHVELTARSINLTDDFKITFFGYLEDAKDINVDPKYIKTTTNGSDTTIVIDMPLNVDYSKNGDKYFEVKYPKDVYFNEDNGINLEINVKDVKQNFEWLLHDATGGAKDKFAGKVLDTRKNAYRTTVSLKLENMDKSYDGKTINCKISHANSDGTEGTMFFTEPVTLHYVPAKYGDKKTFNINLTTSYPEKTLIEQVQYTLNDELGSLYSGSNVWMYKDDSLVNSDAKLKYAANKGDNIYALAFIKLKPEVFQQYIKDFDVTINGESANLYSRESSFDNYKLTVEVPLTFDGTLQELVTINTSSNPSKGGSVTASAAKIKVGETATVKATANEGYEFDYFMIDGVKNSNSSVTVKAEKAGAISVVAYFKETLLPIVPVVPTEAYSKVSDWAKEEVDKAVDKGLEPDILKGKDLTYNINREEFASVAVKLYEALTGKKSTPVSVNPFKDTDSPEILKAYNVGITTGTSETTFEPGALITREQMATMMTRAIEKAKIDVSKKADKKFDDDSNISNWAHDGVYYMAGKEIIKGVGERKGFGTYCFGPKEQSTREQALLIAIRAIEALK